jgi:uncharacterized protein (TIGR01777 family)
MRILITGATGFIGRALTLRLLGDGHEVSAWVRSEARAKSLLDSGVRIVSAGGTPALAAEVARSDAIVNLAGEPILGGRWTAARRQAIADSRISLTTAIADAIEHASPRPGVLVSASAVGYYGDRGDEPLDEQSPPGNDFLAEVCLKWEAAAMRAEKSGVRVFTPRFGVVLGADGGALAQMLPPFRFGAGGPIASGRQWMPWIHLFDLVEIIATALADSRYEGPAIAAAPHPVTNREFAQTLGHVLHRPSLLPVPGLALRALFGSGAAVLTSGQRVNPARLKELGFKWQFETLEAALRNILNDDGPMIGPLRPSSPQPENPNGSEYLHARRPVYLLRHALRVAAPVTEVFSFFSRPQNLGVMTPADMNFQIKGDPPDEIQRETRIDCSLRVGPMPLQWRTRIEAWQPQRLFIDSQERGPYRCWWHEHHFQPDGDATLMEDRVFFAPPFGIAGNLAGHVLIMPALRRIFRFRAQAMRLRFRASPSRSTAGEALSSAHP